MTLVRLGPPTPLSRVNYSTTETLRSLKEGFYSYMISITVWWAGPSFNKGLKQISFWFIFVNKYGMLKNIYIFFTFIFFFSLDRSILFILVTLIINIFIYTLQTMKSQVECCMQQHFTRVCTACLNKINDLEVLTSINGSSVDPAQETTDLDLWCSQNIIYMGSAW